jgi:hypothetical protein
VLVAAVGIIALGQLYQRGIRLPGRGFGGLGELINQAVIFSPIFVLVVVRRHTLESLWLPRRNISLRLLIGIVIAAVALTAFTVVKYGPSALAQTPVLVLRQSNLGLAGQMLFEDVAIAAMMVRLGAALKRKWLAAVLVGALFSGGHIPAMLTAGAPLSEFIWRAFDFILAAGVVMTLQRSSDIWWFWPVHFVMDMTQFLPAP